MTEVINRQNDINDKENRPLPGKEITIALAGNSNVGKSAVFNQLTGSSQITGNWPGKTVERAEGRLEFDGYKIRVIDLPGIYSFSTYSLEETVTRDYIATEKPDAVINVVDAAVLERNLFFTLQLKEMEAPLVVCLNQVDSAKEHGITVDVPKLEKALGTPVVATVAIRGEGLKELVEKTIEVAVNRRKQDVLKYGAEVEARIEKLAAKIESEKLDLSYPPRWTAIKLLENDRGIAEMIVNKNPLLVAFSQTLADEIQRIHEEPGFAVIASERYALAARIATDVQQIVVGKTTFSEKLDRLATHRVFGYFVTGAVIVGLLLWTFVIGNFLSVLLVGLLGFFQPVDPQISGSLLSILWNGVFGGIVAGLTLVIPFVIPFYMMLAFLEDSGILTRVAFMLDSAMHHIGLHGKAIIPLILGFGCSVPAIQTTRIMETRRERLLAALAITFAPCAARTIIILGLVAAFAGIGWALALYALDLVIILVVSKIAMRITPGQLSGLIMEMHAFKRPSIKIVARQTWSRTKSLIYLVFPMYIIGTSLVQVLYAVGVLEPVNNALAFLTVGWLGLPAVAGILLVFGLVRKELILLALVALVGTNLTVALSPAQLIVLAIVGMLYIPCISTIAILAKEFGWKSAIAISAANFVTALIVGGLAARVLGFVV